jgi:hypothetical protein
LGLWGATGLLCGPDVGWAYDIPFGKVVAVVDNVVITQREVEECIPKCRESGECSNGSNEFSQACESLIDQKAILREFSDKKGMIPGFAIDKARQEVIRNKFGGDHKAFRAYLRTEGKTICKFQKELEQHLIFSYLTEQKIHCNPYGMSPKMIRAYYDKHIDQFREPERIRVRRIVFDKDATRDGRPKIDIAREAVSENLSFDDLSKAIDVEVRDGMWFVRTEMNAPLSAAAFALPEGRYTEPVEYNGRYFVALVEERRAERTIPLAEVQSEIEAVLAEDFAAKAHREWVEKLKQKCFIERYYS